jgi:hypothetical protein
MTILQRYAALSNNKVKNKQYYDEIKSLSAEASLKIFQSKNLITRNIETLNWFDEELKKIPVNDDNFVPGPGKDYLNFMKSILKDAKDVRLAEATKMTQETYNQTRSHLDSSHSAKLGDLRSLHERLTTATENLSTCNDFLLKVKVIIPLINKYKKTLNDKLQNLKNDSNYLTGQELTDAQNDIKDLEDSIKILDEINAKLRPEVSLIEDQGIQCSAIKGSVVGNFDNLNDDLKNNEQMAEVIKDALSSEPDHDFLLSLFNFPVNGTTNGTVTPPPASTPDTVLPPASTPDTVLPPASTANPASQLDPEVVRKQEEERQKQIEAEKKQEEERQKQIEVAKKQVDYIQSIFDLDTSARKALNTLSNDKSKAGELLQPYKDKLKSVQEKASKIGGACAQGGDKNGAKSAYCGNKVEQINSSTLEQSLKTFTAKTTVKKNGNDSHKSNVEKDAEALYCMLKKVPGLDVKSAIKQPCAVDAFFKDNNELCKAINEWVDSTHDC